MEFNKVSISDCASVTDTVVIVDVCRAFTTAAYAFAAGAKVIYPVSSIAEAHHLNKQIPQAILIGEANGLPIEGFHFDNSPYQMKQLSLHNKELIQRTSAGTQAVAFCRCAGRIVAGNFVCAYATARSILRGAPLSVNFVITGIYPGYAGDEDQACADYIIELLKGHDPDPNPYLFRARAWPPGFEQKAKEMDPVRLQNLKLDIECCLQINRFNFALPIFRQNGLWSMQPSQD